MKKILAIMMVLALPVVLPACRREAKPTPQQRLEALVAAADSLPETTFSNGVVMTGCSYKPGDATVVYYLKVDDKRFAKEPDDSIKATFTKEVISAKLQKLVTLLNRSDVGLTYQLSTPDETRDITFTSEELKTLVPTKE